MNHEGYRDSTADRAVARAAREEKRMSKTRNCRLSPDEKKIHEQAVKIRKMTDQQIADRLGKIDGKIEKARQEGYTRGLEDGRAETKAAGRKQEDPYSEAVEAMLEELKKKPGIGAVTIKRVRQCCREAGFIE